jgi:hypothetical protein
MKDTLLSRIKRLEASAASPQLAYRIGVLKPLPAGFLGDRHIVIVKQGPIEHSTQWCEFEERPGPAPHGAADGIPRIYLSETENNI